MKMPMQTRCNHGPQWFAFFCALLLLVLSSTGFAQTADSVRSIRTVFVAPLDGGNTDAVRKRLIDRIEKSGAARVVNDAKAADAVLHGSAVIWATGTISNNPRSHGLRQTVYQGYLSAELKSSSNQTLWSYLVTPSHFRTASIADDLADHLAAKLLDAMKSGIPDAARSAALGSGQVALHAAGATFPEPLYRKWFESFQQEPGGVAISYDAIGSEAGIEQLTASKVDLAASDIPPQVGAEILHFPAVAGGVVPIYNLPGSSHGLNLTPQLLADIYSGAIRKWNDPRIRLWNSGAHLPDAEIAVVHRSDGSGTTYVWSSFLALSSPEWKTRVGEGARVEWPIGVGAAGNEGMAEQVAKAPNSIGYVELIYAIQHQLNYAAVRNPAGRFIKADLAGITAAAAEAGANSHGFSILNAPGHDAYPISTFTWLLVPKAGDAQKRAAIASFLRWMLTSGQKQCSSLGYAPLPREVIAGEMQAVDALK